MTDGQGLRVLTGSDIDQILARLDLNKAISSQAAVFSAFSSSASGSAGSSSAPGDDVSPSIQNPHRTTIDSLHATSLFMPARVAELGVMTCKIVSVPKSQSEGGLPAVTAVLDDRGRVKGLVNARRLTAMRNACGSALFLQHCPTRTPPTSLAIFGSGEQAYAHASVLLGVYTSIKTLTFVVRKATERVQRLIERLQSEHPLISVQSVVSFDLDFSDPSSSDSESLRQAVSQAQIIITATSSTTPLFPCSYVSPGTRLILIGSYKPHMHEVDTDLVRRSGTLVVDSVKACMKEAGEIISAGLRPGDMRELGTLEGEGADVGGNDDVVLFKSVGLGVQDVAIAKLVLDEAEGMGIGIIIPNFD